MVPKSVLISVPYAVPQCCLCWTYVYTYTFIVFLYRSGGRLCRWLSAWMCGAMSSRECHASSDTISCSVPRPEIVIPCKYPIVLGFFSEIPNENGISLEYSSQKILTMFSWLTQGCLLVCGLSFFAKKLNWITFNPDDCSKSDIVRASH